MSEKNEKLIVSVVVPVNNCADTVDRALCSLVSQSFQDWEAIVIDDGSTDNTHEKLEACAARDARFRVVTLSRHRGAGAARNAGLREARGEFIAYLDGDDEFHPDYLERIAALRRDADVLLFGMDLMYEDGPAECRLESWDPIPVGRDFFCFNPTGVLAISHRRSLLDRYGFFNELVWLQEDWDLWKRMARAGPKFSFVQAKSGIYHIRAGTLSHTPRLTPPQREAVLANWKAGQPIFTPSANGVDSGRSKWQRWKKVQKIAFISPHCLLDLNCDNALIARSGLQLLENQGFDCQAFCGTHFDMSAEILTEEIMVKQQMRYTVRNAQVGAHRARMIFAADEKLPITLFNTVSTRGLWRDDAEVAAFLTACEIFLTKQRPDAVLAIGLDPVSFEMQRMAMRLDIPVVLAVDDADYADDSVFQRADYAIVPTEFARQLHWQAIGLASLKLPPVVDPRRVLAPERNPEYVTFVNPQTTKGLFVFGRIASELARRRPDIPLLVIEGRSGRGWQRETGIDLAALPNVTIRSNTPDPRTFYAVTKLLLVPSLWLESFGLVAAEAMMNGIPVLASNRGALPETVGQRTHLAPRDVGNGRGAQAHLAERDEYEPAAHLAERDEYAAGGFLFDIPARYTPDTRDVPTAEEVETWIETIIRLWDDPADYDCASRTARERAQQWHPDRLAPLYREFFSRITHQPGPPLVPASARSSQKLST